VIANSFANNAQLIFDQNIKHMIKKYSVLICLVISVVLIVIANGLGYVGLTIIMQKVYIISSMLLVVGLEYFTSHEDFKPTK